VVQPRGLSVTQQVSPDMAPAAAVAAYTMRSHASRPTGRAVAFHHALLQKVALVPGGWSH